MWKKKKYDLVVLMAGAAEAAATAVFILIIAHTSHPWRIIAYESMNKIYEAYQHIKMCIYAEIFLP